MECWKSESDMAEMPVTIIKTLTTGFANTGLARDTLNRPPVSHIVHPSLDVSDIHQSWVEGTVRHRSAHLLHIVKYSI